MHRDLQHQSCVVLFIRLHYPAALGARHWSSLQSGSGLTQSCPGRRHPAARLQMTPIKARLYLLPATPVHLMTEWDGGRGGWCISNLCICYFGVSKCSVSAVPSGGLGEVIWALLWLSECRYSSCGTLGRVMGRRLEWDSFIGLSDVPTHHENLS